jgi:hypothetical protein
MTTRRDQHCNYAGSKDARDNHHDKLWTEAKQR